MQFELFLVREGMIDSGQFVEALAFQLAERTPIGQLAIRSRRLSIKELFRILCSQADLNQPFGQIARDLGILTDADLATLLGEQLLETPPLWKYLVEMEAIETSALEQAREKFRRQQVDKAMLTEVAELPCGGTSR